MLVDISLQSDNQRFQQGFLIPLPAQPFNEPLICKLTAQEQTEFTKIATYFQLADDRNKRNFGMSTFIKHLNFIHNFVVRGKTQNQKDDVRIHKFKNALNMNDNCNYNDDDFNNTDNSSGILRGIVCGILFGNGFLLVNTDKLKRLTKRSKSCVNGCFQKLGFGVYRSPQDLNGFFCEILPDILMGNKSNSHKSSDSTITNNTSPNFFDSNESSAITSMVHKWINPRHWCIRKASEDAPICFISDLPDDICAKYGFPIDSYQKMNEDSDLHASLSSNSCESKQSNEVLPVHNENSKIKFTYDISSLLNRTHDESKSRLRLVLPNLK
ncbi:hypothetical protein M9Y10_008043 [Tritrichomonas musculus]|uniref:Initiator binding domain-containing protein n=1 Tax=Tritrichomonas musculus TaxID=1915356 RepID=A0ABR2IXA1_9EUKA